MEQKKELPTQKNQGDNEQEPQLLDFMNQNMLFNQQQTSDDHFKEYSFREPSTCFTLNFARDST